MYKEYHIFTNNQDEYTRNYDYALIIFNRFVKEFGCARLYEEIRYNDGELKGEYCMLSDGEYPM